MKNSQTKILLLLLVFYFPCQSKRVKVAKKKYICPDGLETMNLDSCSGFMGCVDGKTPFICSDGFCAENQKKCSLRFSKEQSQIGSFNQKNTLH